MNRPTRSSLAVLVIAVTASAALAQGAGYRTFRTFPVGRLPADAATGDFDSNGSLDVVVTNQNDASVSLLLGDGMGEFASEIRIPTGDWPRAVVAVDLDEDGDLDVVTANVESGLPGALGSLTVLLGDGRGGLVPRVELPVGSTSIDVGDFDEDGHLDLVSASERGFRVVARFGDGNGGFSDPVVVLPESETRFVVAADVDGDGHLDLGVAHAGPLNVSFLFGDGSGAFPERRRFDVRNRVASLAVADLDGDGNADFAATSQPIRYGARDGLVSIWQGDGGRGFFEVRRLELGTVPRQIYFRDLDADADPDLVATTDSSEALIVPGHVPGGLQRFDLQSRLVTIGGDLAAVAFGDYDSDGLLDLGFVQSRGRGSSGFPGSLALVRGLGPRGLVLPRSIPQIASASIASADFDGDGHLDLAGASFDESRIEVALGSGIGELRRVSTIATTKSPSGIVVADFDEDGSPDLATAGRYSADVAVHRGDGGGNFSPPLVLDGGTGLFIQEFLEGDLNGDLHADLLVALTLAHPNLRVTTFLGDGAGGFTPSAGMLDDNWGSTFRLGDLDEDGMPDLLWFESSFSRLDFAAGDGAGGFSPRSFLPLSETGIDDLAIADFDGDGHLDVAISNSTPEILLLRLDGRLNVLSETATPLPERVDLFELGVADLDNDGDLDLVSRTGIRDEALVLLGDGGGAFEVLPALGVGAAGTAGLALADFDEDGRLDVAFGAFGGRGSIWLTGPSRLADALRGNVNAASGSAVDVLFVNGSSGGADRRVIADSAAPFEVLVASPPSLPVAPFAAYAWLVRPTHTTLVGHPLGYGLVALPVPGLSGGRPFKTWNNTGDARLGAPALPSSPAPSVLFSRPAVGRSLAFTLQGLIADPASPSGERAVTNAVTVDLR